jgi:hypothetical protein
MGEIDRQRHQRFRLTAGVAKHHPLIPGTTAIHSQSNVGRLLMKADVHLHGIARKSDRRVCVTDLTNGVADQAIHDRSSQRCLGCDFSSNDYQVGCHQNFASNPTLWVVL